MDISDQTRSGIGSGLRNPCRLVRQALFAEQESQLRINCLISLPIPGQKYCRASIAYRASLPGCTWTRESWVSCISRTRRSPGIQSLFRKASRLSCRLHSVIESLSESSGGSFRRSWRIACITRVYSLSLAITWSQSLNKSKGTVLVVATRARGS